MAEYLRIREPGKHALLHPETGLHISPKPDEQFTEDNPLVKAHRWAFGTEDEIAAEREAAQNVTSVPIEQATSAPGEKRPTRRAPRK